MAESSSAPKQSCKRWRLVARSPGWRRCIIFPACDNSSVDFIPSSRPTVTASGGRVLLLANARAAPVAFTEPERSGLARIECPSETAPLDSPPGKELTHGRKKRKGLHRG